MSETKSKLKQVKELLILEKQAELQFHKELLSNNSIKERVQKGVCWYPLQIKEKGFGLGEYPFVVFERNDGLGHHHFGGGKSVRIFTNKDGNESDVTGIIHFVSRNIMKVILYRDDFPDWIDDGKIGVDLLFDEQSYKEMEKALDAVISTEKGRLHDLAEIIIGDKEPEFDPKHFNIEIPSLNASQNRAMNQALAAKDLAIIHGPPGTGKTTTLVETIAQLCKKEKQLLVCAPSNAATDLLTEKLAARNLNVVRIGNLSRVHEKIAEYTLDGKVASSSDFKEIKRIKKSADELRRMAWKYKRNFGKEEREQRKLLIKEAKATALQATELENELVEKVLGDAQVITCTLVGSMNRYIAERTFGTVIIDESAQALEPASWIPISKSEKVIMAGDPFQLPPTVKSNEATKGGLELTLMEKCIGANKPNTLLEIQYRMNEVIMGFSNKKFYDNRLQAHESVAQWLLDADRNQPLEFIDTAGTGYDEQKDAESASLYNEGEAQVLLNHYRQFLADKEVNVGVISPYSAQTKYLQELFEKEGISTSKATVNTVDSFQGQERDVIYISMVRSNENGVIGFLSDYRRMNVAMTRARKKLIMIGDSGTLGSHQFYEDLMAYVDEYESYVSAWEFM